MTIGYVALAVVAGAALLLLADRTLLWMERRGWIYYRRRKAGVGAASAAGLIDELNVLFTPSQRVVQEEKQRQLSLRDDTDSGAPPHRRIDLDSGRAVVISRAPDPDNRGSRR
ncbi:DUF6191 domain-containing protein [Allostreptomyces psammosilenae]|uniref:Uncharacterized protein n=1 Tax=Allostreptomyces psammosilenae TaxID=1892865 RepID=A0A853A0D6_9ACTN|nr:DUF6191 domain-containing protein [Allostreptomyces psammosilenae]NYI07835.1 hypothetical protein [Allostreptomyces psammosilenae]